MSPTIQNIRNSKKALRTERRILGINTSESNLYRFIESVTIAEFMVGMKNTAFWFPAVAIFDSITAIIAAANSVVSRKRVEPNFVATA